MAASYPRWVDDVNLLDEHIIEAHGRAVNMPKGGGAGGGIHIGIFDSAYELPDSITEPFETVEDERKSFITSSDSESTYHCRHVFRRLVAFAPNAKYTFYQTVNENRKLALGAYADAITAAIHDGVDLINISAGDPWRGPIDINPNVSETRRLLDEGISTVAAAGNYYREKQDSRPPVHCPSAAEGVVSVGSFETHCPHEPGDEDDDPDTGPYYAIPEDNVQDETNPILGVFCGERGCVGGESCITQKSESPWDDNPLPTGGKPDVHAPMHQIQYHDDGGFLNGGSSFAAPIVTASLARIFGELNSINQSIPSPYRVQQAVRSASSELPDSQVGKYDAGAVREVLGVV